MSARRTGTCPECQQAISVGDEIAAINNKGWRCFECCRSEWAGYLAEESYSRYGNDLAYER